MKHFFSVVVVLLFLGCSKQTESYSFFAAGHTYGDPKLKAENIGLYKPFKDKFGYINEQPNMKFGVLLGDVVWKPRFWPQAKEDLAVLSMPTHIARGNHDGPLKAFENSFGKSYKSFKVNNDLFIVLDPNLDKWNISNEQLVFLKNSLRIEGQKANNIFIFCHQVIWWSKQKFSKPRPNSLQNRSENPNYWTEIEPILKNTKKPVYLFAGDVGAFSKEAKKAKHIIEYSYLKEENISYITTGMGGGVRDNFIITDVLGDGSVEFRLIHLNGNNMNSLGNLKSYINPN